jgi:hypothetical protein
MLLCLSVLRVGAGDARLFLPPRADAGFRRHDTSARSCAGTATKGRLIPPARALRFQMMDEAGRSIGRRIGLLAGIVLLGMSCMPALALPSHVAVSAGSFFAAATQCETKDLITPGQTDALVKSLNKYLSASDQTNIQSGYARGLRDSTVYVMELKRWAPFTPDIASCYRVQGVLDDYKSQLDAD